MDVGECSTTPLDRRKFLLFKTPSICPGRHFAKDNAFLTIATVLHVFDILPAIDQNGNEMDPTPKMTGTGGLWSVNGPQTLAFRILTQLSNDDQLSGQAKLYAQATITSIGSAHQSYGHSCMIMDLLSIFTQSAGIFGHKHTRIDPKGVIYVG